jgi:HEAT repeat protein
MTDKPTEAAAHQLQIALGSPDASARLQAALTAGTHPSSSYVPVLLTQCRSEPDFYVRDMLTWALTRHDHDTVVELLLVELSSETAQARSQALHTFSKLGDSRVWPAITTALLTDGDDEVARAAWRTAAALAPEDRKGELARTLATQFGRGDRGVQRSLSRAFATLGAPATTIVDEASLSENADVRAHAIATAYAMNNPDDSFDTAIAEAQRIVALEAAPTIEE